MFGTKDQKKPATPVAQKPAKEEKPKAPKPERVDFVQSPAAKPLLNEKGLLTALPGSALDEKLHNAPKKNDFATESLFFLFRAEECEQRAKELVERAADLRKEAEAAKNSPDPAMRAQMKRLARLREQTAALEEQLAKEGIKL